DNSRRYGCLPSILAAPTDENNSFAKVLNVSGNQCHTSEHAKIRYNSSFLKSIFFTFIEEIGLGTSQINNLGAAITVLFLLRTFFAVVGIRYPNSPTDYTPSLEGSIVALIADTN
ncbi:unnamed protein product, partial [Musa banksii]